MRKKVNKKLIVALLSFVLLFGGTFGSSLAWLLDNTEDVTNTFSTSDIDIELKETEQPYKMIPGWTIDKDPKVTVKAGSEACYLFVKVTETIGNFTYKDTDGKEKTAAFSDFLEYTVKETGYTVDGNEVEWKKYEDASDSSEGEYVYYTTVESLTGEGASSVVYEILKDNTVSVKNSVTKEMMQKMDGKNDETGAALTGDDLTVELNNRPKLTFAAAAVQYYASINTPLDLETAYAQVKWPTT